ncbi:tripartite tricarboxylate transporter substrate binding protein [Variovorax sp. V213]|uniref:Bug family tripartite tricarboxylate transporter substrate binding protein n=1 Tax=Variovorax sp. V213 TaxID=3065955 RepID=UPI0034E86B09
MKLTRRVSLLTVVAGGACLAAKPLHAQAAYPTRPIKLVVPYAPGGITDILSRLIAEKMPRELPGAQVIVENRPGVGGILGTAQVAKSPPDGHTILMGAISPLVIAKIAVKDLAYDPFQDLVPITQVAMAPVVLVVHPSVPAKSLRELLALLRDSPDKYNYSSAGAGTPSHLSCELFKQKFGVEMLHIPYKGTGASLGDLVAGQVQLTMETAAGIAPFIQSGRLRPLAVASANRSPLLPDVPTISELGLGAFDVSGWYGYLAPKGTPKNVLDVLHSAIRATVDRPEVASRIVELGAVAKTSTPQEFGALIRSEYERWMPIVKNLNLSFG